MGAFDGYITFCYVQDLAPTARFYEEALGLDLALDQGGCRIYRVVPGAYVGFCERSFGGKTEGVLLTFLTEDVDDWHDRLVAAGAVSEKAPAPNAEYGIYHCFLRDPAGYRVEIQRFENPNWKEPSAAGS